MRYQITTLICCRDRPIPESDLWDIFHCLARAAFVMKYGHEDITRSRANFLPDGEEIVHFDLKPGNSMYQFSFILLFIVNAVLSVDQWCNEGQ